MSSSAPVDNKKKNIPVIGTGPTLGTALTAEWEYAINLSDQ